MDPKLKTPLAVALGVVIGASLFGGVIAAHALVRTVVTGTPMSVGPGMPGPRAEQYGAPQPFGGCEGDGGCTDGACPDGEQPMMSPRGGCPDGSQSGAGVCPDGSACPDMGTCPDGGACPDATGDAASES